MFRFRESPYFDHRNLVGAIAPQLLSTQTISRGTEAIPERALMVIWETAEQH
jgi:transposase